ncbi:MAG: sulfotransferase [Pseudolabrys sp.]|nr:sulfotransferase [Pseudolabrys sp.]
MHNQALIAAAVAAFQQGDLGRARQLAEEQLAKGERLPMLHHLMGLIDCRLGRFASGVERLKRAASADPTNLSYRVALARALIDSGRSPEVLAVAPVPTGRGSAEMELLQVRAEAAFYAGDRAAESDAWRLIADARPQDAMAWVNLGRSLLAQLSFDEAEAAYRRALALIPALSVRHEFGLLLERTNKLEELGELLDAALAEGVPKDRLADLWALRALRSGDVDEASRLSELIDIRPDPFRLNGLKAKIADAAGRPLEAFAAAMAKNWSVEHRGEWRNRARAYREDLRAREQAMSELAAKWPHLPRLARRSPAFLVGFPRSGTTLAETFLQGHPDVRVVDEVPLLETAVNTIGGILELPSAATEQLIAVRDDYCAGLDAHAGPNFGGLVVDKMPLSMVNLPLIAAFFPDARIVFAQRHPCDCVLSAFMQTFILNNSMANFLDLDDAADLYDAAMGLFSRSRDELKLPVHTLVYEDLVADPDVVLRALTDFLGLEWQEGLLDHRATAARRRPIRTPSYDSVVEPLSRSRSGRWRRYETQLDPVLPVLLPWAERLGYGD